MRVCQSSVASSVYGAGGWVGSSFGFSTGVTNGARNDGRPVGFGCGDVKTDALVPDKVFGVSLFQSCQRHDVAYETCNFPKPVADAKLGADVSAAMSGGLMGAVVGAIYQTGVVVGGGDAYVQAQAASCLASSYSSGQGNNISAYSASSESSYSGGQGNNISAY